VARVLLLAALLVAGGGALLVASGVYDVAATRQHTAAVYWMLKTGMRQSIRFHARGIDVPPLGVAAQLARGRLLFEANCARCHGAPGVAPEPFALGLRPLPANLANTAREWPAQDIFWAVKHGIKATGMPGWEYRLPDEALWAMVAYVRLLPELSPEAYAAEGRAADRVAPLPAPTHVAAAPPDPARGRMLFQQYACITCHEIPGVVGASVPVGPPLDRMGRRRYVAGVLENTPDNLARWLREPDRVLPGNAMPNLGVSPQDAADMAAYLATLH
jgi:mono/diheme cytochrome c family protein